MLQRRKLRPSRAWALSVADVEQLLGRKDISLRERTLWRMLYETAARSAEVLALNVEDLDQPQPPGEGTPQGGRDGLDHLQTGTARLLPRLLKGRTSGTVFVAERRARVPLAAADLDENGHARLSYQQAATLFSEAFGGPRCTS
jgi:integrase